MTGISTAISLRFPLSLCISHLPGLTLILTHNDLPSRHQGVLRATVHSRPRWPAAVRAGAGEKVARLLPGPETVLEPEWGKLVKNSPVSSDRGDTGAQAESGSGVRSVLESREWVGHRLARHRLVPGVARSISQIYSLSVGSSVKFQALKPLHWPQAARYENPFIYVIHSLFILYPPMSIVGLSDSLSYQFLPLSTSPCPHRWSPDSRLFAWQSSWHVTEYCYADLSLRHCCRILAPLLQSRTLSGTINSEVGKSLLPS